MANNPAFSKANEARKYRDKYGMEMPTKQLARIMYKDSPNLFDSVEQARDTLRAIEGKKGKGYKRSVKVTHTHPERPRNPYGLPDSFQEKREPFRLPTQCNNVLMISDLHIPYHDIDAITLALDYGVKHKVNTIYINGDLIDNHQVSKFEPDPKKRSPRQEFDATKQFLVSLRTTFPDASIYWAKGNHCYVDGTEVLTSNGFIDFRELTKDDFVAQFDKNMQVSFVKPKSIFNRHYTGAVYDIETSFSRQIVTDGHDVIVSGKKVKAKDLLPSDLKHIPVSGNLNNTDYDISDDLLKLLVNIVCDGCIVLDNKYGEKKMRIQFKLSKERKIDNLKNILDNLEFNYTYKLCKKTGVNKLQPYYIRFYGEKARLIFSLLDGKKQFPEFFTKLSARQANIVYNEIMITDGIKKDNGVFWTTTSDNDVNIIHRMSILNGLYFMSYGKQKKNSGFDNGKPQHFIKIRETFSKNDKKSITVKEYDGDVFCVEMPAGTVITRYKGKSAFSGNCVRWERFLQRKAPEIFDDPYFHLEERLKLNEQRVTLIDDKVLVKIGKLTVAHGHHIFKGIFSPVSPARGAFMKAKQSIIVGHLHRASHHPEVTADGDVISCWSTACLCELFPPYSPQVSNAQHGFAHILVEPNGDYTVKNYQIIKGKLH